MPRPKSAPANQAVAKLRVEKNPSVCLVYDVYDSKGKALAPKEVYNEYLLEERTSWRRPSTRAAVGPKICADGDSWINILWPFSSVLGHQKTFFDVIQDDYTTTDVAYPGDTFKQMLLEKDYRVPIGSGIFDFFIFSGGGNDVLGGGALVELLRWRTDGGGSTDPKRYLFQPLLKSTLDGLRAGYLEIADDVKSKSTNKTRMLVHGYDYPIPRPNGVWIGKPFQSKGFDLRRDKDLIAAILKHLVDQLYSMLEGVARSRRNVTVVNLRGVCAGRWNDELHPRAAASKDFSMKFRTIIDTAIA